MTFWRHRCDNCSMTTATATIFIFGMVLALSILIFGAVDAFGRN